MSAINEMLEKLEEPPAPRWQRLLERSVRWIKAMSPTEALDRIREDADAQAVARVILQSMDARQHEAINWISQAIASYGAPAFRAALRAPVWRLDHRSEEGGLWVRLITPIEAVCMLPDASLAAALRKGIPKESMSAATADASAWGGKSGLDESLQKALDGAGVSVKAWGALERWSSNLKVDDAQWEKVFDEMMEGVGRPTADEEMAIRVMLSARSSQRLNRFNVWVERLDLEAQARKPAADASGRKNPRL